MQRHNPDSAWDFEHYKRQVEEQKEAEQYVLKKPMIRPKTNAFTIALIVTLYVAVSLLLSLLIIHLFSVEGGQVWVYLAVYFVNLCLVCRYLCIKLVECYQHYAKEETRRRCLCMPTCSEYAILALKKHCLIVALLKIRKRLFKTCTGGFYKKDLL